jgi:hypothetical protein
MDIFNIMRLVVPYGQKFHVFSKHPQSSFAHRFIDSIPSLADWWGWSDFVIEAGFVKTDTVGFALDHKFGR